MQSLKFKHLLLLSNTTKSANQFDFQKNLTIITADDNNYGKSTLGKLLYWAIGCDPVFDSIWSNLDAKAILKFSINGSQYETMRYKDMIFLNDKGIITYYSKITGDFSKKIAEILGFHALLPKRNAIELETPPPAYFFVPFYIDQKRSWATAWDNFDKLQQYEGWKATIIKYHIGLLTREYFQLELDKYSKKIEESKLNTEVERIDTTIAVVSNFIPNVIPTIDQFKLNNITREIREDLKNLTTQQEKIFDELAKMEGEKAFLTHQKNISEKIILELDKDYKFVVNHFDDEQIECPLCGTHHDNSITNRASILTDKQQAESQLSAIDNDLETVDRKLENLKSKLQKNRSDIDLIHSKYIIEGQDTTISLNDIIENIAGNSIRTNVEKSKADKLLSLSVLKEEIKDIKDEQNNLLTMEETDAINNSFIEIFTSYIDLLGAEDINSSNINSPLHYSRIVKEGGAAESVRGIFAYYMTIYSLIKSSGNTVLAPLLIDTPNQQEQSITNYQKILELIKTKVTDDAQIILCALKNESLDLISTGAHIINLSSDKLLITSEYENVKEEFEKYKIQEIIEIERKNEEDLSD